MFQVYNCYMLAFKLKIADKFENMGKNFSDVIEEMDFSFIAERQATKAKRNSSQLKKM